METSHDNSTNYFNGSTSDGVFNMSSFVMVYNWVIFSIELPVTCLAIYGVYLLIRADHVAPVYVINLLISDLTQICVRPAMTMELKMLFIYYFGLMANFGFMVCIALERYVMIAHPLWYRFRRTIKYSLVISLVVWVSTFILMITVLLVSNTQKGFLLAFILFLIPYPLVVFSFVGTWRALSRSVSFPRHKQKRILGILACVLFTYTLLFLPAMLFYALFLVSEHGIYLIVEAVLFSLIPLVDSFMYVFMSRDAKYILKAFPCCRRLSRDQHKAQIPPIPLAENADVETCI